MALATTSLPFYNESGLFSQVNPLGTNSSLMMNDNGTFSFGSTLTMGGQSLLNYGDGLSLHQAPWDYNSYTPSSFFNLSTSSIPSSASLGEPLMYPSEEVPELLHDSDFLQQINGCTPVMHPNLVSTLKNMVAPGPGSPRASPYFSQSLFDHSQALTQLQQHQSEGLGSTLLGHCQVMESHMGSHSDVSSAITTVAAEAPVTPPLNIQPLKAVEKSETEDNEAAVVSVDLIQNRRPFRCHHEGCNKTFKNPQTMKMHHKTHYTDGSAASRAGLMSLPTLTSSLKAGHNKKIPSRCPKCKKTFVGLYELRRHYGRKHSEGEKPFGCRKCAKKFYIEVDVRDHEKLCGEPIECKCGLKFAFKCNLVAHKKAHPACQDQSSSNSANSATSTNQSSSSSDDSSQSRGSSPPAGRGTRRQREETISTIQSTLHTPIPDFKGIPEAPEFKMARYDFTGLQFSTEGNTSWASNMHYPSVTFANYPLSSAPYARLGGDLQGQHYSNNMKLQLPSYETFNGEMGTSFNPSLQGMVRLN